MNGNESDDVLVKKGDEGILISDYIPSSNIIPSCKIGDYKGYFYSSQIDIMGKMVRGSNYYRKGTKVVYKSDKPILKKNVVEPAKEIKQATFRCR